MTPSTNLGINSASTKDWLEVTRNQAISEWVPKNLATTTSYEGTQESGQGNKSERENQVAQSDASGIPSA